MKPNSITGSLHEDDRGTAESRGNVRTSLPVTATGAVIATAVPGYACPAPSVTDTGAVSATAVPRYSCPAPPVTDTGAVIATAVPGYISSVKEEPCYDTA